MHFYVHNYVQHYNIDMHVHKVMHHFVHDYAQHAIIYTYIPVMYDIVQNIKYVYICA